MQILLDDQDVNSDDDDHDICEFRMWRRCALTQCHTKSTPHVQIECMCIRVYSVCNCVCVWWVGFCVRLDSLCREMCHVPHAPLKCASAACLRFVVRSVDDDCDVVRNNGSLKYTLLHCIGQCAPDRRVNICRLVNAPKCCGWTKCYKLFDIIGVDLVENCCQILHAITCSKWVSISISFYCSKQQARLCRIISFERSVIICNAQYCHNQIRSRITFEEPA